MALYGGIEAGGTKFVCALGDGLGQIAGFARFDTTTPEETLGRAVRFFESHPAGRPTALGVGSFGPVDLDAASPTYGRLLNTPKPGWSGAAVLQPLADALGVPVALQHDVVMAAVGEHRMGAGRGLSPLLYLTVGTGIGGGLLLDGVPYQGLLHSEMGHVAVPRADGDAFPGACPYHDDCLEGLAAGPAIAARTGADPESLPDDHPVWSLVAGYLGAGIASLVLTLAPARVIVGGGVTARTGLCERIRTETERRLGGYLTHPRLAAGLSAYLVPPELGSRSGVLGALALARDLYLDTTA
jgi:fructokinase